MELFRNTRLKIGISILAKKATRLKRKVHYSDIAHVKSIGIVWDSSRSQDFASLSKFYQKMHDRGIEVRIIGYYPGKELPDQYTAIRYLTCIRKDEISVFYLPTSQESEFFIKNHFDVLIDINFDAALPLSYITSLSASEFKVGLYGTHDGASTFDLMMELKKPVQVENYLTEIVHYLEMINAGSAGESAK